MDVLRLLHPSPSPPVRRRRRRRRLTPQAIAGGGEGGPRGSWVLKILRVGFLFAEEERKKEKGWDRGDEDVVASGRAADEGNLCVGCGCEDCGMAMDFDRDSFSGLLRRVSLAEARAYAKMSYLGSLAYTIPRIKSENLLRRHGLHFVTSSLEKKARSLDAGKEQKLAGVQEPVEEIREAKESVKLQKRDHQISALAAYHITASAAAYLWSQTRGILPGRTSKAEIGNYSPEGGGRHENKGDSFSRDKVASFVATKDSVTAIVAGKEEMKQAIAKDLSSTRSAPCEWYICDDKNGTRYFVIQGSESLASWQANLLFEPVQFEGLDILVHRGIYEAAKGIYEQVLPDVQAQLHSKGNSATFCFTGHSLGGSLSMLVNLMLLIRGEVPRSSLLPVVTFGAPSIMCGGNYLLDKLGLPRMHVQSIMIHRDIVPRAFSCSYPDRVVEILKAINSNFRDHPCLNQQKLLYAPMGMLLILQPEEKSFPHHDLLPPESGLFFLGHSSLSEDSLSMLRAASSAFLNTPHPLETLSDLSAYGRNGSVVRNHDAHAYLTSLRRVVHQEVKLIRKARKRPQRRFWWIIVAGSHLQQFGFYCIFQGGKETLKRLRKLITLEHMQKLVLVIFVILSGKWLFFENLV